VTYFDAEAEKAHEREHLLGQASHLTRLALDATDRASRASLDDPVSAREHLERAAAYAAVANSVYLRVLTRLLLTGQIISPEPTGAPFGPGEDRTVYRPDFT
jgi:hypothetical protein